MTPSSTYEIEVVRGGLDDRRSAEIVAFWAERGAIAGDAARERLPEVICVLRRPDRAIVGVNSAHEARVPPIGNRRFWVYRSFLLGEAADSSQAMVRAAFGALEGEFEPDAGGPIGLCVLVEDPEEMRRRPEADWSDPRLIYAGYAGDGRQIRIGYFPGARVGFSA